MIWIDFAIIGLIFITLIAGLLRGFRQEAFSLIVWLLAAWIGLSFSRDFSVFLQTSVPHPSGRIAASFTALLLLTLVIGGLIGFLLGVNQNKLSIIARLGGMMLGIVHGMIVVTIIIMLAGLTYLPGDPWWKESKLLPPFQSVAIWLRDHIPSGMAEYIHYR